jgi:hypothetical protein
MTGQIFVHRSQYELFPMLAAGCTLEVFARKHVMVLPKNSFLMSLENSGLSHANKRLRHSFERGHKANLLTR